MGRAVTFGVTLNPVGQRSRRVASVSAIHGSPGQTLGSSAVLPSILRNGLSRAVLAMPFRAAFSEHSFVYVTPVSRHLVVPTKGRKEPSA